MMMRGKKGNKAIMSFALAVGVFALAFATLYMVGDAEDVTAAGGDSLTYAYDEETHTLTVSGSGPMQDFTYDDNLNKRYPECQDLVIGSGVTSIGAYAMYDNHDSLTSVMIPSGITAIGDSAFYGCRHLMDFNLPNTLLTIGETAFYDVNSSNSADNEITIPSSVTSVGYGAFESCNANKFTISGGTMECGDSAFSGYFNTIVLGDGLTIKPLSYTSDIGVFRDISIDNMTIQGLTSNGWVSLAIDCEIENLILAEGLEKLEWSIFKECSFGSISFPTSLNYIGSYAFNQCTGAINLTLDSVNEIEIYNNAFDTDSACTISIGSGSIKFCNGNPFGMNAGRSSINLGNCDVEIWGDEGVESWGDVGDPESYFQMNEFIQLGGNLDMRYQTISGVNFNTLTLYCDIATRSNAAPFSYCNASVVNIGNASNTEPTIVLDYEFFRNGGIGTLNIGDSVRSIGQSGNSDWGENPWAFSDCIIYGQVNIGKNAQWLNVNNFERSKVNSFVVDPDNPYIASVDGALYSKDLSTLYVYPTEAGTSFTIPSSVTAIAPTAFAGAPDDVTITNKSSATFSPAVEPGQYGIPETATVINGSAGSVEFDISDGYIVLGQSYSATPVAEGNTVTVTAGPSWLVASGNVVSGTPDAVGSFTVTLSCGSSFADFTIYVVSVLVVVNLPSSGIIVYAEASA